MPKVNHIGYAKIAVMVSITKMIKTLVLNLAFLVNMQIKSNLNAYLFLSVNCLEITRIQHALISVVKEKA